MTSDYEQKTYGMSGNNNNIESDDLMDKEGNVIKLRHPKVAPLSYTDIWR